MEYLYADWYTLYRRIGDIMIEIFSEHLNTRAMQIMSREFMQNTDQY